MILRAHPARRALGLGLVVLALLTAGTPSWAGRPLATDDAGTAPHGTCQLEGWFDHAADERALVLAPACGVAEGLELGLELSRPTRRGDTLLGGGWALKWVPEAARLGGPAGEVQFGLKLAGGLDRVRAGGWQATGHSALLLVSAPFAEGWTGHANLGFARDRALAQGARLLNLALVWAPADEAQLFVEVQANDRAVDYGGAVRTLGGRWWLVPERLGLDLTTSREAGRPGDQRWSVGLGWYGLGL